MNSMPESADFANREVARKAVVATAGAAAVGVFVDSIVEDENVVTYNFQSKLKGYPDWQWSVVLFVGGEAPTISEVLLLPTEPSLQAPAWVPWSERLADYQALQAELEAAAAAEAAEAAEAAASGEVEVEEETEDDNYVVIDEGESALAADVNIAIEAQSNANTTGRKSPGFSLRKLFGAKKKK
jgi:hypothetical protein